MKNKKKKTAAIMGVAAAACLTASTFAVFTDRFQSQAEYVAGTLDLTLTESWEADNAAMEDIFKPGTGLKLDYTLVNDGNRAATVRENFVITADHELSQGAQREFDLYAAEDITLDKENNVIQVSGDPVTPSQGSYVEGNERLYTLSYSLDELVLNGTGQDPEQVSKGMDRYNGQYVLVFNNGADNEYQEVNVDIEYLAQALQHTNTGDETWEDAKVISEKVHFGGKDVNVVPERDKQGGSN